MEGEIADFWGCVIKLGGGGRKAQGKCNTSLANPTMSRGRLNSSDVELQGETTKLIVLLCSRARIISLTPLKKDLPFAFLQTYQAFKSREGITCRANLAERFKIESF